MSKEQRAITLALQALVDSTKHTAIKESLQSVSKLIQGCFREAEALPNAQRAIAVEKMFLKTRSNGVHYLAVKQSWEKFISDPDQSVEVQVEICPVSVDLLLQQIILQDFWFMRSNRYGHGIGTEDTNPSNVDCASASTSINDEDLSEDNDSI